MEEKKFTALSYRARTTRLERTTANGDTIIFLRHESMLYAQMTAKYITET